MIPKHKSAAAEHGKNRIRLLTLRAELRCSEQQFAWRISFVRIYSPQRCEREPGMIIFVSRHPFIPATFLG